MSQAFMKKIFDVIREVLITAQVGEPLDDFTKLIPENNIRPAEDPLAPEAGAVLYYSFTGGSFDPKARRATATVTIAIGSAANNANADDLLDLVRDLLNPIALTAAGKGIVVHKFSEVEGFTDSGTTESDRFLASTSFDARYVKS